MPSSRSSQSPDAPTELELKLSVSKHDLPLIREYLLVHAALISKPVVRRLESRYFDTPERELSRAHMALRLRRVGRQWFQALKASAVHETAFSSRSEWEHAVRGPALELSKLRHTPLVNIAALPVLRRQLERVFDTDIRREAWQLQWPDGTAIELAMDTGELRATVQRRVRREAICEIEMELRAGNAQTLLDFASELASQWLLVPLPQSKAARGYWLAEPQSSPSKPLKVPRLQFASDVSTQHALVTTISAAQIALLFNCAQAASKDIEFVHQARVSLRYMRSVLRVFAKRLKLPGTQAVDAQLRALGQALSAARDWDVFCSETLPRLQKWAADEEGAAQWREGLSASAQTHANNAHAQLQQFLQQPAYGLTALAVERWCWQIKHSSDQDQQQHNFEREAAKALARLHESVIERGHHLAHQSAKQLHRLRIEVKRLRYALDMCASLYEDNTMKLYSSALSALQDELGKLNDDVVAMSLLSQLELPHHLLKRYEERCMHKRRQRLPEVASALVKLELSTHPWKAHTLTDI